MKQVLIAAGLMLASSGAAMAQAPGMTTMWVDVQMDRGKCLKIASQAVEDAGFGKNHETVGSTVYGERAAYTAAARCVVEHSLMFIAVAGPDSDATSKYATEIQNQFKAAQ